MYSLLPNDYYYLVQLNHSHPFSVALYSAQEEQHAGTSQITSGGVARQSTISVSSASAGLDAMAQTSAGMDPVSDVKPKLALCSV